MFLIEGFTVLPIDEIFTSGAFIEPTLEEYYSSVDAVQITLLDIFCTNLILKSVSTV